MNCAFNVENFIVNMNKVHGLDGCVTIQQAEI